MALQRRSAFEETIGNAFSKLGFSTNKLAQNFTKEFNQLRQPVKPPIQPQNIVRGSLQLESKYPLFGQAARGVREASLPIFQNFADKPIAGGLVGQLFPQLKQPLFTSEKIRQVRNLSQLERPGILPAIARGVGETAAYIPAFVATEGLFNPLTAGLAARVPQGVSLGGKLLTSAGRGAIKTAPFGLTAVLPYAKTSQERLERLPGAVAGAAGFGAVAGPVFTLVGMGATSAWNKLLNQQVQFGGSYSPQSLRIVAQAKWPVKGLGEYLNNIADAAERMGNTIIKLDVKATRPRGRVSVKLGAKPPTLTNIQATFFEAPKQITEGKVPTEPVGSPTVPSIVQPVTPPGLSAPAIPKIPVVPPYVTPPAFSQPVTQPPPIGGVGGREIIPIDKSKYPGVETASVTIKPNGTGGMFIRVAPEAQGQGVGTQLVKDIEDIFRSKGVNQVQIDAFPEAVGFWEKMGYKPVEPQVTKVGGLVEMEKILAEPTLAEQGIQAVEEEPFIPKQDISQVLGGMFSEDEIQFLTRGAKDIVTPEGKLARGKYADSVIEVVEQQGKVSQKTVYHESFHAYTDKFADPNLKKDAVNEAKAEKGFKTDQEAEEYLADSFADWMSGRQTFAGRILSFFTNLWYQIRSLLGKVGRAEQIFQDIVARKRPAGRPPVSVNAVVEQKPNLNLKRDVTVTDVYGNKAVIPEDEALSAYELKGGKVLLKDGREYIVTKNQYENIKNNSVKAEVKEFAPELSQTEETIKGNPTEQELTKQGFWIRENPEGSTYKFSLINNQNINVMDANSIDTIRGGLPISQYKSSPVKYGQYQLPGGENYREVLIQAPTATSQDVLDEIAYTRFSELFNKLDSDRQATVRATASHRAEFKSSHWAEPNVLAHIRLNDRTLPNGEKVTFIEEVQSDWAREGRAKGFDDPNKVSAFEKENQDLISKKKDLDTQLVQANKWYDEFYNKKYVPLAKNDGSMSLNKALAKYPEEKVMWEKREALFPQFNEIRARQDAIISEQGRPTIPNHPLLKDWQKFSLKKALIESVNNGSEYLVWINGEQTSARYNLATYVDDINWKKNPTINGAKMISLNPKGEISGSWVFDVMPDGTIQNTAGAASAELRGKKLDEVLGKGLADKIMEKETGTLSGEGLKFGGEWATNLYDKQIPNIIADVTGGKVEVLDMGLPVGAAGKADWAITGHDVQLTRLGGAYKQLTPQNIKVGMEVHTQGNLSDNWVVTEVLGDGKFKAIPKNQLNAADIKKIIDGTLSKQEKEILDSDEDGLIQVFDISQPKSSGQQAIRLTPEIKAKIRGEAPVLKQPSQPVEAFRRYPEGQEPIEEIVEPEEIPETLPAPVAKQLVPQDVIDSFIEGMPGDPVLAKSFYDDLSQQFDLPPFEELQKTATEVNQTEQQVILELKKEAGLSDVTQLDQIGQYASTIRKAVREYKQLTKRTGVADIAIITEKVPDLDGALEALRDRGIEINTMEDLIDLVPRLPVWRTRKAGIRVGKSKAAKLEQLIVSGATPEQLLTELRNSASATRQGIRTRITRAINAEKISGPGQQRYFATPEGEFELFEKTSPGITKGVGPTISDVIPPGQKALPGTGVIHPDVVNKLVENQIRRLREFRRRSGITAQELDTLSEQVTGKKVTKKKGVTYQERKDIITKLEPENRAELMGDVLKVRILAGQERAKILQGGINQLRTLDASSPLEDQFGVLKAVADTFNDITNLEEASRVWEPIGEADRDFLKRNLGKVKGLPLKVVREPLAARLADVERSFYGPSVAVINTARKFEDIMKQKFDQMLQTLTPGERQATAFLITGIKGKQFQQFFNRTPTAKESEYAAYLSKFFDAHLVLANTARQMAGLPPLRKIKNYLTFVINEQLAGALGKSSKVDYTKLRTRTNKEFREGLFSQDLNYILPRFLSAASYYLKTNLFNALLKTRSEQLSQKSEVADVFGRLVREKDIYGMTNGAGIEGRIAKSGVDAILGQLAFPKMLKLSSAQQAMFKTTEFYQNDPAFKDMVDKGVVMVPRAWAKIPSLTDAAMKAVYMTKLGFANTLFSLVNLAQPTLSIPFTSIRDVASAYRQLTTIMTWLNPTLKDQVQNALETGGLMKYYQYGAEYSGDKVDLLNTFLDKTSEFVNYNVKLTETINRSISLLAGMNYLVREGEKQGIQLSKEGIVKAATEFSGLVNVKGGPGYAPFITRDGIAGVFYMFQQFPLQALDILSRAAHITLSPSEKGRMWELMFVSGNAPAEDIIKIRQMKDHSLFATKFLKLLVATFGTAAIVAAVTGSTAIGKRYLPVSDEFPYIGFPDFQGPITQLVQAAGGFFKDPQRGLEDMQTALWSTINVSQAKRMGQGLELYNKGYTTDEQGRLQYVLDSSQNRIKEAIRVGLFGISALPQTQEREELYKKSLEATQQQKERTKQLTQYIKQAQKIEREQGTVQAMDYLKTLSLEQKDVKRIMDLMQAEEMKLGSIERQLQGLDTAKSKAEHLYNQLRRMKSVDEQQNYLKRLYDQKILTEDIVLEFGKVLENPPQPGLLERAGEWIQENIFRVESVSAVAPSAGLLQNLQTQKQEAKIKHLAPGVQDKLRRSEDFNYLIDLQGKYAGTSFGEGFVQQAMKEKNITPEMLEYDLKTRMTDDVQLEQILSEVQDLPGDERLAALVAMRYVSEGSRKPLLSEAIINKMVKMEEISKEFGGYLKDLEWNQKTGAFEQTSTAGGKGKKPKKISLKIPKTAAPKRVALKISVPKFKPLAKLKTGGLRIKPPALKTRVYTPQPIRLNLRGTSFPKTISQLGRSI